MSKEAMEQFREAINGNKEWQCTSSNDMGHIWLNFVRLQMIWDISG